MYVPCMYFDCDLNKSIVKDISETSKFKYESSFN